MSLTITAGDEPMALPPTKILIYAAPGTGKSTLVNSASRPLTLAFDPGIYRAANRQDSILINNWQEALEFLILGETTDLLTKYDTIVIDTVGMMLDIVAEYLIQQNPKLRKSDGGLSQNTYQPIKFQFVEFTKRIMAMNKDILFVAHEKEYTDNDVTKYKPAILGSNFDKLMEFLDFCGRVYIKNGKRILEFSPTDISEGKNPAQFPPLELWDIFNDAGKPDAIDMKWIIANARETMSQLTADQKQNLEWIQAFQALINSATKPADFDIISEKAKIEIKNDTVRKQVRERLITKTTELEIEYDTEKNKFAKKKQAE